LDKRILQKKKSGVSSIIGGLIFFAMILVIGVSFFYLIGQDNLFYQQSAKDNSAQITSQESEHLTVYGFSTAGELGLDVNNTGITASIISYWIYNGTSGALLPNEYKNATTITSAPSYCGCLPHYIAAGSSWNYSNTGVVISSSSQRFIIKVLTARGSTAVGTYPSALLTSSSVDALVAGGFGSLQMSFTSFNWYDYTSGPPSQSSQDVVWSNSQNCNYNTCTTYFDNLCANGAACSGGSYVVDLAHPHPGSLSPEGYISSCQTGSGSHGSNSYENCYYNEVPMVFSVSITNDDPNLGTIVLDSETNIWITESCDFGTTESPCANGNPVFVFYAINVNPTTGAITDSTTGSGSFSQIVIPYGATKTLYYGAASDLSLAPLNYVALSAFNTQGQQLSYYGQFSVFMLFSGTKITQQSIQTYGQNIPFESTNAADNLGYYSETPTTCTAGTQSTFSLSINDSVFSNNQYGINEIVLNASAFTVGTVTPPSHWTDSVSSGFITYTASSNSYLITNGAQLTFTWKGTPPSSASGEQLILPLEIYWNGGTVTVQSQAEVCND
jgi:hypothetical protein